MCIWSSISRVSMGDSTWNCFLLVLGWLLLFSDREDCWTGFDPGICFTEYLLGSFTVLVQTNTVQRLERAPASLTKQSLLFPHPMERHDVP